jgi:RNA polymerase sigma-70 factor (ECF subfamily)
VQDDATPADALIRQARAGDAAALETLLGRYREFVRWLVHARCAGRLRTRVDSSDLVQETLLRAAQNISQLHATSEEEWRAWLTRIAEREVIHQLRHHVGAAKRAVAREQPLLGPMSSAGGRSRLEQWWARSQSSPSQVAIRKERVLLLADALARLPEDYRLVLVLRHLEGLDFAEVAERLNRTAGAARVLWLRALKRLRAELVGPLQTNGSSANA